MAGLCSGAGLDLARDLDASLRIGLEPLRLENEEIAIATLQQARAAYEVATEATPADFDRQDGDRLRPLHELVPWDIRRMSESLDSVLPLELPVQFDVVVTLQSSSVISLDIDVPEPGLYP